MKRFFLFITICFFIQSCSLEKVEQDEVENFIGRCTGAEQVHISFNNTHKTENGDLVSESSYLLVEILNSKRFESIKHNDRLFKLEADKLRRFISDSVQFDFQMDYEELRIDVINRKNFLFFLKDDTKTMTYEKL